MSDYTPLLTVAVLLEELIEVTEWRMLGAYLNVPVHALDKINIEHDGKLEHCKMYMLQYWLDTSMTASWIDVARALEHLNMLTLAARLKLKYLRTSPATIPRESLVQPSSLQSYGTDAFSDTLTDLSSAELVADVEVVDGLQDLESDLSSMMNETRKDLADCSIVEVQFYLDHLLGVDEFRKCQNIDEVLRKLYRNHIDIFNVRYLEYLIIQFHQSDAIVETIEKYEKKKEKFLRSTTVKEFQQAVVSRAETVIPKGIVPVTIRIPEEYCVPRTMKDMEKLAKRGFSDHHQDFIRINVIPGGSNWSFYNKKEVALKRLQQKAIQAVPATTDMAVQVEPASPYELTSEDVIHAYDVSLRANKEKEQQLQSQLATVQQESQDRGEQLSKAKDENYDLHKERLVLKQANELQQEELKRMQQTVTCEYEARLAASEEEQQRLLQEVGQWKKMFHAREMEMSRLQRESEQLRVQDKLSTSYQQQLKDHNVKEQSTETDFTAQNAVLSFRDKQDISDEKWSVATVDTGVQANYLAVAPDFLHGVEVYGETVLEVVGDKPQKLEWPGYGFFIEVPKGALAPGVTASVAVKVILGGQFTLPDENSQLISAIYWVKSSEVFLKEVAVNIQHYAVITSEEQCSKFRFIIAKCSQEILPYTFREKEGLFNAHTQYGAIKVKRFSIFSLTGPKGIDSRITSLKFYKPRPSTRTLVVDFDFVVLYNHEPFLKDVRERYHSKKYQEDTQNQMLVFKKKKIVLDLPAGSSKPKVVDGWKILPMTYPQIEKCDIEQYRCGKNVAGCTIELMWTGDGEAKELYYQVNIIGAKEPANYFYLRYNPHAAASTYTVPDTPSGATPTVNDVTTPTAEHSKQDDPLNKQPRMNDLLNRVACRAMDKWEVVGLQLNIPRQQLNTIQKNNPILCYADVFDIWERKSGPPFTWATIVEALRSPIVKENSLAKEIEDWLK